MKARLKELEDEPESDHEKKVLERCLKLIEIEATAAKVAKEKQTELDKKVFEKYSKLTEPEIKILVVENKWFPSIKAVLDGEVQQLIQRLANRVKDLEDRYAESLPQLESAVGDLGHKVEEHLKQMGFATT